MTSISPGSSYDTQRRIITSWIGANATGILCNADQNPAMLARHNFFADLARGLRQLMNIAVAVAGHGHRHATRRTLPRPRQLGQKLLEAL